MPSRKFWKNEEKIESSKIRVAIIGAGPSGIITARHLSSRPGEFDLTVLEQNDQVGGTWVYTNATQLDENGLPVHSGMYKNLRTNIPKELMMLPDFPFQEEDVPSYVHHSVIKEYLQNYTQHFNLQPYIKLNTVVTLIEPKTSSDNQTIYTITYKDLISKVEYTKDFDAVVICNGHESVGYIPEIEGSHTFTGDAIHSHQYRVPEKYTGRIVCILGAAFSGIDITLEVSKYAAKIYLSHNLDKLDATMPSNVEQRSGIASIDGNTFIFNDGTTADVDDFIYCTGYKFTYPFLSDKIELLTEDNHVEPIYKQLIHTDMPNLFFMGLPDIVIPFPMFHIQAQYILKVLEGHIELPSPEEMRMDFMREKQMLLDKGISIRHINKMNERQWLYYNELATAAGVPSLPPVLKDILDHFVGIQRTNFTIYKNYQYKIIDEEKFEVQLLS